MNDFPFPFPIGIGSAVGRYGPGTYPQDEVPGWLQMPERMRTFEGLPLPEASASEGDRARVRALLAEVQAAVRAWQPGQAALVFDLGGCSSAVRRLVDQVLGAGEVSARVQPSGGVAALAIQESLLAGVWRVRGADAGPDTGPEFAHGDRIEVGDLPAGLLAAARAGLERPPEPPPAAPGVLAGPAVLAELAAALEAQGAGGATEPAPARPRVHAINLSLLPFGPEDGAWLDRALGRGAVTILSRGYGNCRITATAVAGVWWVQHFNSQDVLILNSLEVAEIPEVVRAAPEDLADSARHLDDILDWLG